MPDPSALFLADRRPGTPGSVVAPVLDGHRPLLVEVQALVAPFVAPDAAALGAGSRQRAARARGRGAAAARATLPFAEHDVHTVVAGGVTAVEPGADLALALALASAHQGVPVPPDVVACGEVGLGGELRQVHQTARRLAEAARLGLPAGDRAGRARRSSSPTSRCSASRTLDEAVRLVCTDDLRDRRAS